MVFYIIILFEPQGLVWDSLKSTLQPHTPPGCV